MITSPGRLILVQGGRVWTYTSKVKPKQITLSRWIRTGDRKQFVKQKRERIEKLFINTRPRSSHFILTGPLPVCSTCFYSGGPLATPPWPDGDHRRLHNGDCVRSVNDRPVHTSYKEPPRHTHIQTSGLHNRFSLLEAVFHGLHSRQTWWRISVIRLQIIEQECPRWKPRGGSDNGNCLVLLCPHDDLLFITFRVMSCYCII